MNEKSLNQYYGKYFECCVVAVINNTEPDRYYKESYSIPIKEKEVIYLQAKQMAEYLGNGTAEYIGNYTSSERGDIIFNEEYIELKRVSSGNGTYFNTTIFCLEKYGFNFRDYLEKNGLYDTLEKFFGSKIKISRKNNSPVSQADSSIIRHNYDDIYKKEIIPLDKKIRIDFCKDLGEFFIQNRTILYQFINDMLTKNTETTHKGAPDRLIVYNYSKNKINEINIKDIKILTNDIKLTEKGINLGFLRIQIGWQNGNGLNNPTIRVFLN